MKKIIIISSTVCAILGYILGVFGGYNACKSQRRLDQANLNTIPYKIEVIKAQRAALKAADKVMDNNQLFDTDGSDIMSDYLHKTAIVDSLYRLEN